jgi:phage-related protein
MNSAKMKKYAPFIIGGLVLGVFAFIRNRSNSGTTTQQSNVSSDIATMESTIEDRITSKLSSQVQQSLNSMGQDINGDLTTISQKFNEISSKVDTVARDSADAINTLSNKTNSTFQDTRNYVDSQITATQASINDAVNSMSAATVPKLTNNDRYSVQREATKEIEQIQDIYKDNYNRFAADGKISDSEKSILNKLHNDADTIGINADLQSGSTTDGSSRLMIH